VNALRGIAVIALGAAGLVVAISALPRFRRPVLSRRLTPYLGALGPRRSSLLGSAPVATGAAAVFEPARRALAARLHTVLDDGQNLSARLQSAGSDLDPSAFRGEQVTWGLLVLVGGLAFALLLASSGREVPIPLLLGLGVAAGVGGVVARDRALGRKITQRRAAVRAALPTVVDLVCLSVTAGESLRSALGMVVEVGGGPLGEELRRALRAARGGTPLVVALEERARLLDLAPFDRFVAAIGSAQERGIPLADALRSLAFDLREHEKRELIEVAGKKQISMLVPVVTLILPVAIVFAFYPGVVAIRTLAR
jgi:tight adherence protein C